MWGINLNAWRVFQLCKHAALNSNMDAQYGAPTQHIARADTGGTIELQSIFDEKQTTIVVDPKSKSIIVRFHNGLHNGLQVQYTDTKQKLNSIVENTRSDVRLYTTNHKGVEQNARELAVKLSKDNRNAYTVVQKIKSWQDSKRAATMTEDSNTGNQECKFLQLRIIRGDVKNAWSDDIQFAYVMQKMDCNLLQWLDKTSNDLKTRLHHLDPIIASIERQMNYLLRVDREYKYADLKPENVGILQNKDSIEVYLLDLESVMPYHSTMHESTFSCFEEKWKVGFAHLTDKSDDNPEQFCKWFNLFILILHFVKVHDAKSHKEILNTYSYRYFSGNKWVINTSLRTMKFFHKHVPQDIRFVLETLAKYESQIHFGTCLRVIRGLGVRLGLVRQAPP